MNVGYRELQAMRSPYRKKLLYLSNDNSTGWIDTGIPCNTLYKVCIECQAGFQRGPDGWDPYFGGKYLNFHVDRKSNDLFDFRLFLNGKKVASSSFSTGKNTIEIGDGGCILNGKTIVEGLEAGPCSSSSDSFWLFKVPEDSYPNRQARFAFYSVKLFGENGNLLRDMIPVIGFDYAACMYDKVSRKTFENKGSGEFTYVDGEEN